MIAKELEIDYIIRQQIKFKVMLKTLFTKLERYLISNNKAFVLRKEREKSSSSEGNLSEDTCLNLLGRVE